MPSRCARSSSCAPTLRNLRPPANRLSGRPQSRQRNLTAAMDERGQRPVPCGHSARREGNAAARCEQQLELMANAQCDTGSSRIEAQSCRPGPTNAVRRTIAPARLPWQRHQRRQMTMGTVGSARASRASGPETAPWTGDERGLLGGRLSVLSKSDQEEVRPHVAMLDWT